MPPIRESIVPPSPLFPVIDAIVSRMKARPAIHDGILVSSSPVTPAKGKDYLMVIGASNDQDWWSSGRYRVEHTMRIQLAICAWRDGTGDETATAARNGARAILDELAQMIRGSIEGLKLQDEDGEDTVRQAQIASVEMDAGVFEQSCWCGLDVVVTAMASTAITLPDA